MRSRALTWYSLRWPREVTPEQVVEALRLLATVAGEPIIVESVGSAGMVAHRLAIPHGHAGNVVQQLRVAIPGLALDHLNERLDTVVDRAIALRLSTRRRVLRIDDAPGVNRAVLTALSHVGQGEQLVLQWVLGRRLPSVVVPSRLNAGTQQSWVHAFLTTPASAGRLADSELLKALRMKQAEPGWKVSGRVGVSAASKSRQRQLIGQLLGALRTGESPGVRYWVHSTNATRVARADIPWRLPLRLNVSELATIASWPVSTTNDLPVARIGSRLLSPSPAIRRSGRVIGQASYPGKERPLSLMPADGLRHFHAIGPTGSGKSTVLLNLITQDIAAGRGVLVIEPKGDLIAQVLERIPKERRDDVVLIDPTDSTRPVGLNPMAPGGRSPELVADQLLGVFHSLFDSWGPRTQEILHAALLTLARVPGATLVSLLLLLTDARFRRSVVAKLDDPIVLEPFWAAYEQWSEQERANAIAPAMRRLRPFVLRPDVRAMIGQAKPRFEISELFTRRRIVLVNLAKGLLGPETASLLGSLVISGLWQAALGRAAIEPERRHPVFVYADEFQDYLALQTDLADALAQARGLGVGFVLAHQYLDQLDTSMRSAVLANVQSRVAFRLAHKDAVAIAGGGQLAPEDFESLGAYECYAQLVAGGAVQPWCNVRTFLPSEPISDPADIRAASRDRYGVDSQQVEAELRRLIHHKTDAGNDDDIGLIKRTPGGAQ